MDDPLRLLVEGASQPNPFPATSRYAGLGTATHTRTDGTAIVYVTRSPAAAFLAEVLFLTDRSASGGTIRKISADPASLPTGVSS